MDDDPSLPIEDGTIEFTTEQQLAIQRNMERAKQIRYLKSQVPQNEESASSVDGGETSVRLPRGGFIPSYRGQSEHVAESKPKFMEPEPTLVYPLEENEKCCHCTSIEIDFNIKRSFGINVCANCREMYSERYKLVTKTTAKEEYLLTEEELGDTAVLPFITKPNPYKSSWSDMQLYLAGHVRSFAIGKWGSMEALQQELERRAHVKEIRTEKKFKDKLSGIWCLGSFILFARSSPEDPISRDQEITLSGPHQAPPCI